MLLRTLLLLSFVCSFLLSNGQQKDSLVFTTYYYEGGAKSSEGFLKDGKPEGYWKSFYRNGQLKTEGNRINYALDGPWIFYSEEGKKVVEINYSKDKKNGPRKSFNDEKVYRIDNFVDDKIQGFSQEFYPGGELKKELPYKDDQKTGKGYGYHADGRVTTLLTYKSDVLTKKRTINLIDESGQKQGMWMQFHKNRNLKVEGPYINDLKNGYWKFYTGTGNLIKVEKWIMGVLQENAEEVAKIDVVKKLNPNTGQLAFKGSYRNGIPEGVHREYGENGEVVSSKVFENGVVLFEGIVDDLGRKQGPWKEFYPTGELKAEGDYKNNLKIRKWVYYYINGKVEQTGDYLRGKPEGVWTWYYENRQVWREEEYVDGLEDGPSIEYNDTGAVIAKGNYVEGLKDGEWYFHVNDYKEIGSYFDGLRTGDWKHFQDEKLLLFEGAFENGLENGLHVHYYGNGQVQRRGKYAGGQKEGIWEYFEDDGNRIITIEYAAGKEIKYNGDKISYGRKLDRELAKEEAQSSTDN